MLTVKTTCDFIKCRIYGSFFITELKKKITIIFTTINLWVKKK